MLDERNLSDWQFERISADRTEVVWAGVAGDGRLITIVLWWTLPVVERRFKAHTCLKSYGRTATYA
jgi:hypothetical protein